MIDWLDKIEVILIKCLIVLFALVLFCQYAIGHSRWAEALVLLNRLEGIVYTFGGQQ